MIRVSKVTKVTVYSDEVPRTTQMTWLPALWVGVMTLYTFSIDEDESHDICLDLTHGF